LDEPLVEGDSLVIPHAYNSSKIVARGKKVPVKPSEINFGEMRKKARLDRRMRDRDEGGWAAEWND